MGAELVRVYAVRLRELRGRIIYGPYVGAFLFGNITRRFPGTGHALSSAM